MTQFRPTRPAARRTKQVGSASVGYVRALLDYFHTEHLDAAALGFETLLKKIASGEPRSRIPIAQWAQLLDRAIATTCDPNLPLKLGASLRPHHSGLIGVAALCCSRLSEAIDLLIRYERIVDDANQTQIVRSGDLIELRWLPLADEITPAFMQMSLANWVTQARRLTERDDLVFEAHFAFPKPARISAYSALFKSTKFRAPVTKLVAAATYLQLPIPSGNRGALDAILSRADAELQTLQDESEFTRNLKLHIATSFGQGVTDLEQISANLGLSPRSVQLRLTSEGLSYRQVLDSVRLGLAEHYLRNASLSLSDIAFLLGYSEQSNFQHAFKRWTGTTPKHYRASSKAP